MASSAPVGRSQTGAARTPRPATSFPLASVNPAPRGATSSGILQRPVNTSPTITFLPPGASLASSSTTTPKQTSTVLVPHSEPRVPSSPLHHQSSTTRYSTASSTATASNPNTPSSHTTVIVAATVVSSVIVLGLLYRAWILIQRRRHRRQAAPLPPAREDARPYSGSWNPPRPLYNEHDEKGLPFSALTSFTSGSEDMKFVALSPSATSPPSLSPPDPAFPPVGVEGTVTPTPLATDGAVDSKDIQASLSSSSPYPSSSSPYPRSSSSAHPPSSHSPSPTSLQPPRLTHAPPQKSNTSSLHSSHTIHSTSGNRSPSRHGISRPRGAPHLPHIRNTLDIKLPQPLTASNSSEHPEYGGVSSIARRDSRHSVRSADSWAGAVISRNSSQTRSAADEHLSSESNPLYAWRRSMVPPMPLLPSPFDQRPGD